MALIKEGGVGGISFEVGAPGFLNGLVRMIVGCGGILTNTAEDGLKVQFRIFTAHRVELDRLKEHFLNGRGYNFFMFVNYFTPSYANNFYSPLGGNFLIIQPPNTYPNTKQQNQQSNSTIFGILSMYLIKIFYLLTLEPIQSDLFV